jgi:uncharacterized membrane protein
MKRHPVLVAQGRTDKPSGLTLGQRSADKVRNGMGSWPFVITAIVFLGVWMVANSLLRIGGSHGKHGFDPYPWILLNLMLSILAGLQGAILLIAAKRQDQISSDLAQHDYDTNLEADAIIKRVIVNTELLHSLLTDVHEVVVATTCPHCNAQLK